MVREPVSGHSADPSIGRPQKPRAKPTKAVPSDRISFQKQLDLLRAFAAVSGQSGRAVTTVEVAAVVNLKPETISTANAFFLDLGFLSRGDGGFVPGAEVISFQRAHEWNSDNAAAKLAPRVAQAWFAVSLMPRLSFRALEEDEAVEVLADVASAGPDYKTQLKLCLEYLVVTGVVQRDGTLLRAVRALPTTPPAPERKIILDQPEPREQHEWPVTPGPPVEPPLLAQQPPQITQGVQFNISVNVDMKEIGTWPADRIMAFFNGVAQVLAAKSAIEKGGGQ